MMILPSCVAPRVRALTIVSRQLSNLVRPSLSAAPLTPVITGSSQSSVMTSAMIHEPSLLRPRSNQANLSTVAAVTGKNAPPPEMFCRQCEQTHHHVACVGTAGVCGKSSETAAMQDLLMQVVQQVGVWCNAALRANGTNVPQGLLDEADTWNLASTFSTLTNVNFSTSRITEYIRQGLQIQQKLQAALPASQHPSYQNTKLASLSPSWTDLEMDTLARSLSIPARQEAMHHDDVFCLQELATYGMKGVCAYAMHCHQLKPVGNDKLKDIMVGIHEVWTELAAASSGSISPDDLMPKLLATVLKVGEVNGQVLSLLDELHAEILGVPEPTPVKMTAVQGPCILVSGHDMMDLHALLQQTQGTGINVYTHGEMLPAHAYPKLRAFDHLVGNFGTAWQNQRFEFASFPGPVIVTTNCIIEPRRMYKDRIYTMNEVGVDGVQHIGGDRDYSAVIRQALAMPGFPRTIEPATYHMAGYNHRVLMPMADQLLQAVKEGQVSRIFLIGGCDGSQFERSYFTELAEETPADSIILTLGCAKNRIIHSEKLKANPTLPNGLPRVLDMGQCNDSYSAVQVALGLAKAAGCGVNDLPLSLALSHLEQKAAAVLLTLLSMGVKNIRLGPSLPAYLTPNVLQVLQQQYQLKPTVDVQEDLKSMMEGK